MQRWMRWLKELAPSGVEPDDGATWFLKGVATCGSSSSNLGCAIGDGWRPASGCAASVAFHLGVSSLSGVPTITQHLARQPDAGL